MDKDTYNNKLVIRKGAFRFFFKHIHLELLFRRKGPKLQQTLKTDIKSDVWVHSDFSLNIYI